MDLNNNNNNTMYKKFYRHQETTIRTAAAPGHPQRWCAAIATSQFIAFSQLMRSRSFQSPAASHAPSSVCAIPQELQMFTQNGKRKQISISFYILPSEVEEQNAAPASMQNKPLCSDQITLLLHNGILPIASICIYWPARQYVYICTPDDFRIWFAMLILCLCIDWQDRMQWWWNHNSSVLQAVVSFFQLFFSTLSWSSLIYSPSNCIIELFGLTVQLVFFFSVKYILSNTRITSHN